jgi:hypothetical protein
MVYQLILLKQKSLVHRSLGVLFFFAELHVRISPGALLFSGMFLNILSYAANQSHAVFTCSKFTSTQTNISFTKQVNFMHSFVPCSGTFLKIFIPVQTIYYISHFL